jgi:hypothetical protein
MHHGSRRKNNSETHPQILGEPTKILFSGCIPNVNNRYVRSG